jgi:hypothetical protein
LIAAAVCLLARTDGFAGGQAAGTVTMGEFKTLVDNLNFLWVLLAAALVFIMQAGFMCLEAGLAQAKHSINVAVKTWPISYWRSPCFGCSDLA